MDTEDVIHQQIMTLMVLLDSSRQTQIDSGLTCDGVRGQAGLDLVTVDQAWKLRLA